MPDRRVKECKTAAEIAAAKLAGMRFREGDPSIEDVQRAMLVQLQAKFGEQAKGVQPEGEQQKPATAAVEKDTGDIEAALGALSERYISTDAMNEALGKLEGVSVKIPQDEVARLKGLLPPELTDAHREAITKLQEACEDNAAPLMMQLPAKILVDGKERPFTIATMYGVMKKAKDAGYLPKPLWLSDYVTEATKDQTWDSKLGVWTSTCLEGSKSMEYRGDNGQLAYQKQVLGEGREIHADMILAMALRYIQSGKELMRRDFMRLNDADSDGCTLNVGVNARDLALGSSHDGADSRSGVGGSLRISS